MRRRRSRITGWASALAAGLASAPALGQAPVPVPPTGPAPAEVVETVEPARPVGPVRRAIHHLHSRLVDTFIGYPEQFVEPPLGFYLYEMTGIMRARADAHDFTVYRSDFVDGTTVLSPIGAQRLSLMASRIPCWLGSVVVEWTPDRPGLAEARRGAILAAFQGAGLPVVPERVVVAPSPYPGMLGADANNNFSNLIYRDQAAAGPGGYSLTPSSTASFGGGAR